MPFEKCTLTPTRFVKCLYRNPKKVSNFSEEDGNALAIESHLITKVFLKGASNE